MTAFNLQHLPFNSGWRWKYAQTQTDIVLEPGEEITLLDLDTEEIEGTNVIAGWLVYGRVTSNDADIVTGTRTQPPGPRQNEQTVGRSTQAFLDVGATAPQDGFIWAKETTIGGNDRFTSYFNAFTGVASTVRFPKLSLIFASNTTNNDITITDYEELSILVHKPERFFKDMLIYNILAGTAHPRIMEMSLEEIEEKLKINELITELAEPKF